MTAVTNARQDTQRKSADFLTAELLRYRLEAIVTEGGLAIERTAISPIVTSSKDYSCTLLDPAGRLVAGGGKVRLHYYGACSSVDAVINKYGKNIAPRDVYLANDPHHDGAMHPQDVFIMVPVFMEGRLIAWFASCAHMLDMGGMSHGSYAPNAVECFQEAIRFPPVRLVKAGAEQDDIWDILLNNIRIPDVVQMDMRSLIAGCYAGAAELSRVVADLGVDGYLAAVEELAWRVEKEMRRRIDLLEPGTYHTENWIEWQHDTYRIPCTLTVGDGKLLFDFAGTDPQTIHFINSRRFIIRSAVGQVIGSHFAHDLPYNYGVFNCFDVLCPEGTLVHCKSPAPIGSAHTDVGWAAQEGALRALMMAIEASAKSHARPYLTAPPPGSGFTAQIWGGVGPHGRLVYWTMSEAISMGGAGSAQRDGTDLGMYQVGNDSGLDFPDVEVWEGWYPWEIESKKVLTGRNGAGMHCCGGRLEIIYGPSEGRPLAGNAFGNRQRVPHVGLAGGYPGAPMETFITRKDGTREWVLSQQQDLHLDPGDRFTCRNASAGGWGDPLDRPREQVETDIRNKRLTVADAAEIYGVIPGDARETEQRRAAILKERLERATPALEPLAARDIPAGWHDPSKKHPLATGVVQEGGVAVSERSGAPLALAPNHWTDGCPRIRNFLPAGTDAEIIAYLDPATGHLLFVDVVALAAERSFTAMPKRWAGWKPAARA